jgi:hypothetical protein
MYYNLLANLCGTLFFWQSINMVIRLFHKHFSNEPELKYCTHIFTNALFLHTALAQSLNNADTEN